MSLHRFPHESVITVSSVTDEAVMPSAVTIIKPLRIPQWTQSESDSWHLPRNTCQSHTTCQIDTFRPVSCLFFFFNLPNRHNLCLLHTFWRSLWHFSTPPDLSPILQCIGSLDRYPHLTDLGDCDLSVSIVEPCSRVNSLLCLMWRVSSPALFNKRRSIWCYRVDHRAPEYSWVFLLLSSCFL